MKPECIYICRAQVFHNGHLHNIIEAFETLGTSVVNILLGSANKCVSHKNPFTVNQRINMIGASLSEYDKEHGTDYMSRVTFTGIWDYNCNDRWAKGVVSATPEATTHIIGYEKDDSSFYLQMFPDLKLFQPEPYLYAGKVLSATTIREMLYELSPVSPEWVKDFEALPTGARQWIYDYTHNTDFDYILAEVAERNRQLDDFKDYKYRDCLNINCADNLVVCNNHILLVERKQPSGRGLLALAGGHKESDETFESAGLRELKEETLISVPMDVLKNSLVGSRLFDDPNRSMPLTRVSMVYYYQLDTPADGWLPEITAGDDASVGEGIFEGARGTGWYNIAFVMNNPHLFYDDHFQIIQEMLGL